VIPRSLERDFVGYGPKPPHPRWPGGARLALNFVLNYEEGSEYSMMDGDGVSDAALTELASAAVPRGERDLAAESMFEYGSRVGFWRLHRIFKERGLPMTVYACALALERNPPAARGIRYLLSWLALGRALQARRSDGARAYPSRRRKP
jgi:peptidoglycan/xylan/chitin deacetylase (PgdA/CDA1 family)